MCKIKKQIMDSKSDGPVKVSSWTPQFFEEEMQAIQPDYDLVMERYSSGPATLLGPLLNEEKIINNQSDGTEYDIAKNLLPDDEKETVMMMRNCGIESSLGGYLNSNKTLPTHQTKSKIVYEKNLPILLDEEFFKLKPSGSISNSSSENSTIEVNSISLESSINDNQNEVQSPLDKILGINRAIYNIPLEKKYIEDFPALDNSMQIKKSKRFCTPKKLYDNKKKT